MVSFLIASFLFVLISDSTVKCESERCKHIDDMAPHYYEHCPELENGMTWNDMIKCENTMNKLCKTNDWKICSKLNYPGPQQFINYANAKGEWTLVQLKHWVGC